MTAVRPAPGPRAASRGRRRAARDQRGPVLNRELSWIEFNARVLHEARDARNPLLERVKFLAIFASNLDEFFQVRVSGLRRQRQSGAQHVSSDGMTPARQLDEIRARVNELVADHSAAWADIRERLAAEGVEIVDYAEVPEHHETLRRRFHDEIFPVLTPLAVDPGHPFPYISTLSLSIAVGLRDPETGETRFARVKIPPILPRLFGVERDKFVLLDQVIEANLDELFRGMEILDTHLFRVTRDADIAIEEDEADDLLLAMEEEVRRRRFGEAVRLEVERSMPEVTRRILIKGVGVRDDDAYEVAGMMDLTALWQLVDLDRPDLKAAVHVPVVPQRLLPPDEDEPVDVFAVMRAGDLLLHHPYESFTASVERFVSQAADDPEVLTIKQTLYRTSGDSPIIRALIRAAERGKQVVVLVEIKARFDEEANIVWARKLEQAGAHVVYGLVGLKTHSKVLLVVRREGSGLRRYVHIGTGNYNSKTARLYVDLGILSVREELGADVTDLFNVLTGLSRQSVFRRLLVAPMTLRARFLELVERETANARAGQPARIVLKVNSLVDTQVVEALYEASRAGVEIDCIVRGACCLLPGLPGVSETIRVRSIIGEFLEHSRIWMFANGGRADWLIGSADLMERNLDRRVEVVTPVEDHEAQARLARIVEVMLADDRRSWQLRADGRWDRTEIIQSSEGVLDTFATLKEDAVVAAALADVPRRPHAGHGSMDPRA
ncbi:MAG: RNA degradosome polyphosphate kinase [Chloroflexi bacterium RBG_16_72_14]|nr:MAG: RNA degradosome polyphosphate kinase [Chloroflexi bacterium RBG_16_72_14]